MSAPLITIAMPVYSAEATVAEAIDSVLKQTFADFELLIVDDGSKDETLKVVKLYSDPRIVLISDDAHKGIAPRLNQMIEMARGEYFARMDADDIMFPHRLEKQLAFLRLHTEADVVGSKAVTFSEKLGVIIEELKVSRVESGFAKVDRLTHPTVMGKTEWFRKHRYNEKYSGCEDYELWLRVRNEATLLEMQEPLLYYRERMRYNVSRVWRERFTGLRLIWQERQLFGSLWNVVAQTLNNMGVMLAVPVIHLLHLDKLVISRRVR